MKRDSKLQNRVNYVTVRLRSVVVCFFLVGESDSSGKETLVGKESFLNPFGNALEVMFFSKRTEKAFDYRLWFKKKHGSRHLYAAGP
jgi:hypothetical protein